MFSIPFLKLFYFENAHIPASVFIYASQFFSDHRAAILVIIKSALRIEIRSPVFSVRTGKHFVNVI